MLTNNFEEFLTLIKRVADKDLDQDQDKYLILSEIIRPESAYNPDPQNNYFLSNLPEYKICIPKNLNIKVSSFLEKIYKILLQNNHAVSYEIIEIFISLFALLKEYSESKLTQVDIFNNLFRLIETSELSQYVFLNFSKEKYDYEFFDFKVGNLNFDKIKYKSLKAGSPDVYEIIAEKEKNNLSIERKAQIVNILSFYQFRKFFKLDFIPPSIKGSSDNKLLYYLLNEYFFRLSNVFHVILCNDFERQQNLYHSLSTYLFQSKILNENVRTLNIFFNVGSSKHGWCSPGMRGLIKKFDYDMPWKNKLDKTINNFNLKNIKSKKNWSLIEKYSKFISLGMKISNFNDYTKTELGPGYIHYILSLELIFGNDHNKLIKRVALVYILMRNKDYKEYSKFISKLLKKRSEYIHNGIEIQRDDFVQLEIISRSILLWLINANKINENFNINELCKKIDAACALLESDSKIPSKLIEDLYFSIDKELINLKNL